MSNFSSPTVAAQPADRSPSAEVPHEAGVRLGRSELLTRIAEGGMAVVWLARVTGSFAFEKLVAVKTIQPALARDPAYQRTFLDESTMVAQPRHPNVVELLNVGVHQDVPYQVLEWLDGDSLPVLQRTALKRKQRLPLPVVLKIVAQVCAGLHAAHELRVGGLHRRVVHRDVSPQNVLVSQEGQVKLIDFGIAKAEARVSEDSSAGVLQGKMTCMVPEHLSGGTVDHRADIWAAGVLLHQLLVGAPPRDLRVPGRSASLVALDEQLDTLHTEVAQVIGRAPAFNPDERFSSARKVERELDKLLSSMDQ